VGCPPPPQSEVCAVDCLEVGPFPLLQGDMCVGGRARAALAGGHTLKRWSNGGQFDHPTGQTVAMPGSNGVGKGGWG
jgi:hypothetical protein